VRQILLRCITWNYNDSTQLLIAILRTVMQDAATWTRIRGKELATNEFALYVEHAFLNENRVARPSFRVYFWKRWLLESKQREE
jgi:hypothetical protein